MSWRPQKIVVFDFEYHFPPGCDGKPEPLCVVAAIIETDEAGGLKLPGRFVSVGWAEMQSMKTAPWPTGPDVVAVAFSGHGDLQCMDRLGWPRPARYVDLMVELRNFHNGVHNFPVSLGLYGYLDRWAINHPPDSYKSDIRDLILSGQSHTRPGETLDYCRMDVELTAKLVGVTWPHIDWRRAIGARGPFLQVMSVAESRGLPVDVELLVKITTHWPAVRNATRQWVNRSFGVELYDETGVFKIDRMAEWLDRRGLLAGWPRTGRSGQIMMDDSTLRDWSKTGPEFSTLYEARRILDQGADGLRLDVADDGRCRTWLNPFGTKTGRNAPREPKSVMSRGGPFLFGGSRWVRSLLKPPPGWAISYIDWVSQEIHVAATLTGDENLLACYQSPDPYIEFAKLVKAVPPNATKKSHPNERDTFKITLLGLGYGMGHQALAHRLGTTTHEAEKLIRLHHEVFATYWSRMEQIKVRARLDGVIFNPMGWRMNVDHNIKPTTLGNWPVQSAAAAMLHVATPMVERAGVRVLATVHDAIIIEAPAHEIEAATATATTAMERASQITMATDVVCRTDPKIVKWPERYMDEAGAEMFHRVMAVVERAERRQFTQAVK
jgi:hypothetical protein